MTPGYFSEVAALHVEQELALLGKAGFSDDVVKVAAVLEKLRSGEKFLLPENGKFIDDWGGGLPDKLRLPFDVTVLEYDIPDSHDDTERDMSASSRRIAVCWQDGDDVLVVPVSFSDNHKSWSITPWYARIWMIEDTAARRQEVVENLSDGPTTFPKPNPSGLVPAFTTHPLLTQMLADLIDNKLVRVESAQQISKMAMNDCVSECMAAACLIEALNCVNVETERLHPPRKVARQRERHKRQPLYSYHVLTIDQHHKDAHEAAQGGTHASPRLHIRRGHIRVMANGKRVFVRQHFVGTKDRGVVDKDYRMEVASAA